MDASTQPPYRASKVPNLVEEPTLTYGAGTPQELAALRKEVEELKKQVADLAGKADLSQKLADIIDRLTKG